MKKIIFKDLSIKNFLSIGDEIVKITFVDGINIITGENKDRGGKNGVGKTSILQALTWCIFNETLAELKNNAIVHNQSKVECEVSLNFDVTIGTVTKSYNITRKLNPSSVSFSCDGVDGTLSTIDATNGIITGVMGGNIEVFKNSVIMTANNTTPFMAQKKTEKRKFIEGILQLSIFTDMLKDARITFNEKKNLNDLKSQSFLDKQKTLTSLVDVADKKDVVKKEKIKLLEDIKNKTEKDLVLLYKQTLSQSSKKEEDEFLLEKQNHTKSKIDLQKQLVGLTKTTNQVDFEMNQHKKDKIDLLKKGNTCPTCKRDYTDVEIKIVADKVKEIDFEIEESLVKLNECKTSCEIQQKLIDKIDPQIAAIDKKLKAIEENKLLEQLRKKDILTLERKIKETEERIEEVKNENNDMSGLIDKLKEEIKVLEEEITEIQKDLNIYESVKFVLSEEGVKTFIIKKILQFLNGKLNYYLSLFDAPCKCTFDDTFDDTIINDKGLECSYHNFSGGEKQRINLAVILMFQDLGRSFSGVFYNVSFYDELLDSALDEKGTELVLDILKSRVQENNESIYIITHGKVNDPTITNIILLEKKDGKTRLL